MKTIEIHNLSRPLTRSMQVGYCESFLCRLRGLMFRTHLADEEGLLLVYERDSRLDSSIHMMFMRFDLAVIWIDSSGKVVDKILARQWKPAYFPSAPARFVLEVLPGWLGEFEVGDQVKFS